MKGIFRYIVIGSLILYLIWFAMPYSWIYFYKGEELNLLSWANYGAKFDTDGPMPFIILLAYIIVSIGLVLLKKWARTAFLSLTVVSVVLSGIWGFLVSPPVDAALGYIVSMSDGAILTIAYLTSLGGEFE